MQRDSASTKFPIGSVLPAFELPNVDGRRVGRSHFDGARASLVIFTCNHCPYVKGSEEMLLSIVKRYESEGLKTLAISSNDAAQYPEDSFEKMKERSKALGLSFPYLYDESQDVARLFDAACTPELYLFDAACKLVYHGSVNDSPRDPAKVSKDYLSIAVQKTLAGERLDQSYAHPIGCSIKWKH